MSAATTMLFFTYLFVSVGTITASAQSGPIMLDGPKSSEQLQPHISYYLDEEWERTIPEILGEFASEFKPIQTKSPDFGYTNAKVWLRLDVENVSELTDEWRLYFRENFKQLLDVYVIRENFSVENVLSQDLETGFQSRPIQYPELVAPLIIKPGTSVTVLVNYWSEASSHLPLSIETASSFASIASNRVAKNFVHYGMIILLLFAAFLAMLVYRHIVFPAYIFYAGSILLYLMHSDGVAYQYLWPSFPMFNSAAPIYTGAAAIIAACAYARIFLVTWNRHPWMDRLLLSVMLIAFGLLVSSQFVDNQIVKRALIFMALVAVLACASATVVAALTRFKQVRFFLFSWIGFFVAALIMNLRHLLGIEISRDFQYDFMRFAIVLDAALAGLAIADRYNQLRLARQHALEESVEAAERNLQLTRRLTDLEDKFAIAADISIKRDINRTNTIHDLKQPIHALRLKVHSLMDGAGEKGASDVEETFEYLERLVSSHLEQEQSEMDIANDGLESKQSTELSLNEVLKSVHEMFLPDAKAKELTFEFVPSSLKTNLPSLVLMRLAANLVSNAINYTQSGKILMGCRRVGNKIRLEIHDTGAGMSMKQFSKALKRSVRLDDSSETIKGHGYGLSIVNELADEYGLRLSMCPLRTSGSGIRLEIPRTFFDQ